MADEAITIRVTYQEGWALVLYLAANGDRTWSINAFDESLDLTERTTITRRRRSESENSLTNLTSGVETGLQR